MDLTRTPQAARPRLSEVVLDHLTGLILSKSLKAGDQLPSEIDLANAFGVSKPPVRDALRHLAAFGVVDLRQGKPATVAALRPDYLSQFFRFAIANDKESIQDVIFLRRIVECGAVPLAAENITPAEIVRLKDLLGRLDKAKFTQDEWIPLDAAFHHLIAEASRNVLIPHMMIALKDIMEESIRLLHRQRSVRHPEQTFQRHADIAEALFRHDPVAAEAAMVAHFDATKDSIAAITAAKAAETEK